MARKEIVQYIDDLDGTALGTDNVETVEYTWKGAHYVIDLSKDNAELFASQIGEWIQHSHRVARHSDKFQPTAARRTDLAQIRTWARSHGYTVSDRGRIPAKIIAEYDAA